MPTTDTLGALTMIRDSKLSQHIKRELMGTLLLDAHTLLIELGMGSNTERKNLLRLVNIKTMANTMGWKQLFNLFEMHYPTLSKICKRKDIVTGRLLIRKMRKVDMAFLIALDINEGYTVEDSPFLLRQPKKIKDWYNETVDYIQERSLTNGKSHSN